MQKRILSILSIGWFSPSDVPPLFHEQTQYSRCQETGAYALFSRSGEDWMVTLREMQRVTPVLAFSLKEDEEGARLTRDPVHNPYTSDRSDELLAFLAQEEHKYDIIVIGYCLGEGARRVRALPERLQRKTVVVHWDPIPSVDARALRDLGVLAIVPRANVVAWLLEERIPFLGEDTQEVAQDFIETLEADDDSSALEVMLAQEGAGLGV